MGEHQPVPRLLEHARVERCRQCRPIDVGCDQQTRCRPKGSRSHRHGVADDRIERAQPCREDPQQGRVSAALFPPPGELEREQRVAARLDVQRFDLRARKLHAQAIPKQTAQPGHG